MPAGSAKISNPPSGTSPSARTPSLSSRPSASTTSNRSYVGPSAYRRIVVLGSRWSFTSRPTPITTSPTTAHTITRGRSKYLEKSPRRSRFRLFTDSQELADEYSDYTQLPLRVLPIPHVDPAEEAFAPSWNHRAEGLVRLTYLGDARMNKGFHLLPQLFQQLEPEIRKGRVEGEVQANVRFADEWQAVHAATRLRRQEGVVLHERELTSSEYYALLDRADIVLLPYLLENYHSQTSGIFAEALARGKPVVVPRGSWMARQLGNFGAGATFLPGDRRSLYEACRSAIDDFRQLQAQAREAASVWKQWHSPATYLRVVMESLNEDAHG